MNAVQISHDGFARTFTYRERAESGRTCPNCGQPARFRYQTVSEARMRIDSFRGPAFCGINCARQYLA